jgi:hypothetical protein
MRRRPPRLYLVLKVSEATSDPKVVRATIALAIIAILNGLGLNLAAKLASRNASLK